MIHKEGPKQPMLGVAPETWDIGRGIAPFFWHTPLMEALEIMPHAVMAPAMRGRRASDGWTFELEAALHVPQLITIPEMHLAAGLSFVERHLVAIDLYPRSSADVSIVRRQLHQGLRRLGAKLGLPTTPAGTSDKKSNKKDFPIARSLVAVGDIQVAIDLQFSDFSVALLTPAAQEAGFAEIDHERYRRHQSQLAGD